MGNINRQSHVIRVGLAGVGRFGQLHAAVLADLPGVVIGALADPDAEQLGRVAARYGITQLHHDAEALITDDSLDAIVLATPDEQHVSQARAALQQGKHLFVEKPLAPTWQEAVCDVAVAQHRRLHQRRVGDFYAMVQLVALAQASQDGDCVGDAGLVHKHLLEAAAERAGQRGAGW